MGGAVVDDDDVSAGQVLGQVTQDARKCGGLVVGREIASTRGFVPNSVRARSRGIIEGDPIEFATGCPPQLDRGRSRPVWCYVPEELLTQRSTRNYLLCVIAKLNVIGVEPAKAERG